MDTKTPPNDSLRNEAGRPTYEAIHSDRNHQGRDRDSISTVATNEDLGHSSEKYNEKSVVETGNGVNISRAEAEFAQLNKELSRTSNISRKLSRTQSRQSHKNQTIADVEKGQDESETSSDEPFDLESVLRGNRNEEEAAGIKSKRIGVVWDGLTVSGIGGVKNYVKVSTLVLCLCALRFLALFGGCVVGWLFLSSARCSTDHDGS
jgi:ATP-binding cassette subfamily G (WHITE) protein 2 (SNQ2)